MEKDTEQPFGSTQKSSISLRDLLNKYLGYWGWIVTSFVLAILIGYLYIQITAREFQFTASVLVADQSQSGQMNAITVVNQFDPLGMGGTNTSIINDEEMSIHSRNLMEKVVNQLQISSSYYQYNFLNKEEIYKSSPLIVSLDSAALNNLHSTFYLKITPYSGNTLALEANYNDQKWEWEAHNLPVLFQTPVGDITISRRPGISFPTKTLYVTISNPFSMANRLANNALITEVMPQTNIINLTLVAGNPQKGKDILNTLIQLYNQEAIEQINKSAINTAKFIDMRLKLLSAELSNVEMDVEHYKQTNKLTDINSEAKLYLDNTNQYQQQSHVVENQLHLISYIEEFLRDPQNHNALVPNLGLTDVGLIAIINGYNELVLQRERIARNSSAENPVLNAINHQVESARTAILTSVSNARKGLLITNQDLSTQGALMATKIREVPRQEREVLEIQRQQQVKQALYLFLLQKREEASLTMAVKGPKAKIIDSTDNGRQISPRTTLILLIFALLGLIIPILIIYFRDLLDTKLHNITGVERLTNVPVLTELGHNLGKKLIIDHHSVSESNSELFRLLRTKLQFVLDYPTQKVVLVTSTQAGEGKSFISINLAITLSMTEKRVLLIGMDLRKPQISAEFGLSKNQEGVTSYLTDAESDVSKLIYSVPEYPNLYILPAGMIPPNPNELILRHRLDDLFESLKDMYDYVVMDTAPVGAVSDTLLLHRLTDITLYVCRAEYSDKHNIDFVNRLSSEGTLKPMYLILNDVRFEKRHYYYQNGYSYGYGHYGHSKQTKERFD